jgi:hypothetical protein
MSHYIRSPPNSKILPSKLKHWSIQTGSSNSKLYRDIVSKTTYVAKELLSHTLFVRIHIAAPVIL